MRSTHTLERVAHIGAWTFLVSAVAVWMLAIAVGDAPNVVAGSVLVWVAWSMFVLVQVDRRSPG